MNPLNHKEKLLEKCSVACTLITKRIHLHSPLHEDEIIYFVLPGKVVVDEILHDTYGIGAYSEGTVVDQISDLSPSFDKVKALVDLCNEQKLSLIHLRDVAEDFISE